MTHSELFVYTLLTLTQSIHNQLSLSGVEDSVQVALSVQMALNSRVDPYEVVGDVPVGRMGNPPANVQAGVIHSHSFDTEDSTWG